MTSHTGSNPDWVHHRLKERGLRTTRPRRAILDIFQRKRRHLTARNIHRAVREAHPDVGLASIYRTLELFCDIGVVSKHDFGESQARYELAHGPQEAHHHHLICKECNKAIDYPETGDDEKGFLRRREKDLSKKYGFKIEGHFIDFFGLCRRCKKTGKEGRMFSQKRRGRFHETSA